MKATIHIALIPMNYENQLLRRKQVEELTSLSRSSIYRLMDKGLFPKSKGILGGNIVIWVRKEIEDWIKDQIDTAVA